MRPIDDILTEYKDSPGREIDKVTEFGRKIGARLRKHRWFAWTSFPLLFENCRSESEFYSLIDNFNGWLKETESQSQDDKEAQEQEKELMSAFEYLAEHGLPDDPPEEEDDDHRI